MHRVHVADLLGGARRSPSPDHRVLVRVARRHLREKYLRADMGITGGNFGIADTGTGVVVANEGNAGW